MTETGVLQGVLSVFTAVGNWIAQTIPSFIPMFYDSESGLTFLGVLACCGIAFGVCFLCIGLIQRFLHFAG